jgi:hypothetical protein
MADETFLRGIQANTPLVGTDNEIKTQLSLLLGIGQIIEVQGKGLDIDFYKFVELFEDGFSTGFLPKQNVTLNPKYWGQSQKNRPKVRILLESSKNWQAQGYALIELQPDRTIEQQSYLLFGTPAQLIQQVMYWMNLHRKLANLDVTAEDSGSSYREPLSPNFKDWLQLTLYWRGITEATGKNHTVNKSIRLKQVDPKTVSLAFLKQLGARVLEKFDQLTFKTGHIKVKYTNWDDGFQTWGYFDTEATGYKVIESMGDIINKPINKDLLIYERRADPTEAFPVRGERTTVATKPVRIKAKAPIANMKFHAASLTFPYIQHKEQLCNISGYIIKDLNFLSAYED